MVGAIVLVLWTLLAGLATYLYSKARMVKPVWHRIPALPGLPPDMEYQLWSVMADFSPNELSQALVQTVNVLSPVFGRAAVFNAMKGARVLIFAAGTYPGSECNPVAANVVMLNARWAAVEVGLRGAAHAMAHLIERHVGKADYSHASWDQKGLTAAVATYQSLRDNR